MTSQQGLVGEEFIDEFVISFIEKLELWKENNLETVAARCVYTGSSDSAPY